MINDAGHTPLCTLVLLFVLLCSLQIACCCGAAWTSPALAQHCRTWYTVHTVCSALLTLYFHLMPTCQMGINCNACCLESYLNLPHFSVTWTYPLLSILVTPLTTSLSSHLSPPPYLCTHCHLIFALLTTLHLPITLQMTDTPFATPSLPAPYPVHCHH